MVRNQPRSPELYAYNQLIQHPIQYLRVKDLMMHNQNLQKNLPTPPKAPPIPPAPPKFPARFPRLPRPNDLVICSVSCPLAPPTILCKALSGLSGPKICLSASGPNCPAMVFTICSLLSFSCLENSVSAVSLTTFFRGSGSCS